MGQLSTIDEFFQPDQTYSRSLAEYDIIKSSSVIGQDSKRFLVYHLETLIHFLKSECELLDNGDIKVPFNLYYRDDIEATDMQNAVVIHDVESNY